MMRRRYFLRGVYVACGIVLFIVIVLLVQIASSYEGTCGGFLPALAGPRPCSFWEYWPLVLAILFLPPIVGYFIDRRAKGHAS
jgi:hypothetical protein